MICPNCSKNISDGFKCCPYCGTRVVPSDVTLMSTVNTPASQPVYQPPVSNIPTPSAEAASYATSALVFGILSLALGWVFGIIFGIIAKSRANMFLSLEGSLYGKAKVGRILGKVGFILGIITSVIIFIYIIIFIIACSYETSYYYYY